MSSSNVWAAAWCFHPEGDPAAETWVRQHARRILAGQAGIAAAAIRRKATKQALDPDKRRNADRTYSTTNDGWTTPPLWPEAGPSPPG